MDWRQARGLFPVAERYIFLNHAGVSPLSERARAAVAQAIERLVAEPFDREWAQETYARLHEGLGRLLGAPAETIAITRNTAHGVSLLAQGLDWRDGDNVVGARGEYPANVYPWMNLRDRGVEYRLAEPDGGRVTPERVFALVDERTRVVALSHVGFWNGYRIDLEAIGSECRRRGIVFAVDGIQSAGVLRWDLARLPVDFVAAGAYKWLLGPPGIGFAYFRPELAERVRPVLVGVHSVRREDEYFDYELELVPTSRRFEESGFSVLDRVAFTEAVELFLEVGTDVVEERALSLAARLAKGLAGRGYELVEPWPREPAESSSIVSFRKPGSPPSEPLRDLQAANVVCRTHRDFVRLGPHFYNTEEEIDHVLEVLGPSAG